MKRIVAAMVCVTLLAGCGVVGRRRGPTTPTVGQRIPVLGTEGTVEADPLRQELIVQFGVDFGNTGADVVQLRCLRRGPSRRTQLHFCAEHEARQLGAQPFRIAAAKRQDESN